MLTRSGHIFWLFGLSGSGKSTLAARLSAALGTHGLPVLSLDGDALRSGLCSDLGFSDASRAENLRRAAEVAKIASSSGLNVVASFITPLEVHRGLIASIVGPERISLIYLSAPLAVCQARDVKGLYAKARTGLVPEMTGVSSRFEPPLRIDFVLDTAVTTVEKSAETLLDYAGNKLTIKFR